MIKEGLHVLILKELEKTVLVLKRHKGLAVSPTLYAAFLSALANAKK